jgi:hypothetical protein
MIRVAKAGRSVVVTGLKLCPQCLRIRDGRLALKVLTHVRSGLTIDRRLRLHERGKARDVRAPRRAVERDRGRRVAVVEHAKESVGVGRSPLPRYHHLPRPSQCPVQPREQCRKPGRSAPRVRPRPSAQRRRTLLKLGATGEAGQAQQIHQLHRIARRQGAVVRLLRPHDERLAVVRSQIEAAPLESQKRSRAVSMCPIAARSHSVSNVVS